MKKKFIFLTLLFFLFNTFIFAEEQITSQKETSQVVHDLRRFEIITLGSMPFVTMDLSLGYTAWKNIVEGDKNVSISPFGAYKYDPEKDGDFLKSDCGKMISATLITSICVGAIDFTVNIIKRHSINSKNKKNAEKNIIITDLENDPDATKLSLPENREKESKL